jgi:hypothetical protein
MTITALAELLGVDRRSVGRQVARGCPTSSVEAAKEWRMQHLRSAPRPRAKTDPRRAPSDAGSDRTCGEPALSPGGTNGNGNGEGSSIMVASIQRLQQVEKATCAALAEALAAGRIAESSILRRDYVSAIKSLHTGLLQQMKFDIERGKLIRLTTALDMINAALHEPLTLIKGLAKLGCTSACKSKLEIFTAALLEALKSGAAEGLRAAGGNG